MELPLSHASGSSRVTFDCLQHRSKQLIISMGNEISSSGVTRVTFNDRCSFGGANIRSSPSLTAPVIDILLPGQCVTAVSRSGGWIFVKWGYFETGWIKEVYDGEVLVRLTERPSSPPPKEWRRVKVKCSNCHGSGRNPCYIKNYDTCDSRGSSCPDCRGTGTQTPLRLV